MPIILQMRHARHTGVYDILNIRVRIVWSGFEPSLSGIIDQILITVLGLRHGSSLKDQGLVV